MTAVSQEICGSTVPWCAIGSDPCEHPELFGTRGVPDSEEREGERQGGCSRGSKGGEEGWGEWVAGVQICRPAELFEQALENEIVPRIPTLRTAYSAAGAWTPCLGTHARKVDSRRETLTS